MKPIFRLFGIFALSLTLINCKKENPPAVKPTANAGASLVITLPVNSVTVSGSGTTTNGSITSYLWTLVSGPNVPVITSPGSATTTINGLVAGTYIFQLTVTDHIGLTGVDTMSVLVKPIVQQTVTIQPTNNPNDAHIDSYNLNGGSGDTEVEIGTWTIGGTPTSWRSFIKFDQSMIPAGATIVSANLYLYSMPTPHAGDVVNAQSGTANAFYVERITANWNPAVLNWNTSQPVTTATNRALVTQSTSGSQDATIDVTSIVQDMQTNGNYGFAFRLQTENYYNIRQYASSYYTNASLHPKLVIVYQ